MSPWMEILHPGTMHNIQDGFTGGPAWFAVVRGTLHRVCLFHPIQIGRTMVPGIRKFRPHAVNKIPCLFVV